MKQFVIISTLFSILNATTINVPADYATIQGGIDASVEGDTVLVAQGTYSENLVLEKEIILASHAINDDLSSDWTTNENIHGTIVSGAMTGSCLIVRNGNIQPSIIGFTFQDGVGTNMAISNSCSDKTERSGGAIVIYKAYPNINYNRFSGNGMSNDGGQAIVNGGAISHFAEDDVEFDEDRNHHNQHSNSSRDIPGELNIQNNLFVNNTSGDGENFYSYGYDGSINVSGSVFENIDCESSSVNEFVLRSVENAAEYIQNDIVGDCIEETTYYVSPDGDDDNSGSETEPFRSVLHALSLVKPDIEEVTTIYLASGVYSGETTHDVFPIVLPDKVHLIGENMETTILDADASSSNEAAVMIIKEVEDVYVSNITLTGGYSEIHGCTGGGGLLITANDMFNLFNGDGGTGVDAISTPVIENVVIEDNHSHNGGGVSFFRTHGPELINVTIRNNQATAFGGGLFCYGGGITMSGCTVDGNQNLGEGQGGGMMLAGTEGTFDNMTIINNTANGAHGGGLWTNSSGDNEPGWVMTNSTISGNHSDWFGGGMMLGWSRPTIINCTISENVAYWGGGGIMALEGSFILQESLVTDNGSGGGGGGIFAWGPLADGLTEPPVIEDCIVSSNGTNNSGGGIYVEDYEEAPVITRTFVVNNGAADNYGGILVDATTATLTNVTVSGNSSGGGGIGLTEGGHIDLTNSIVWNNSGAEISISNGSATVNYSDIQGGYDGDGNINENPLFTDAENGDFTLQAGSPCIDVGTTDTDGNGTDDIFDFYGYAPDMGAHEFLTSTEGLQYFIQGTQVILAWNPMEDIQYYLIERSTDENFESDVMSQYITQPTYTDDDLDYNVMYYYRVSGFIGYWSGWSNVVSVMIETVSTDEENGLPKAFAVHQNFPNPFNPTTTLRYDLPEDGMVNVTIYDMMGRIVNHLVNGHQSAGYKTTEWNGTNSMGEPVSAGMYLYQINAGQFQQTKKMILLK